MVQRAIWRNPPDEPRTVVGMVFADRAHYADSPLRTAGCLGVLGTIYFLCQGELLAAAVTYGIVAILPRFRMRRSPVKGLVTVPLPAPAYPVTVEVTVDGATIGWDHGIVTFVDGWLYFEGPRTNFSLSRADVRQRRENHIELDGGGLRFYPEDVLSAPSLRESGLQTRFASQLDRWYRIDSAAKGISILPPNTLHISGWIRAWAGLVFSILQLAVTAAVFLALVNAFNSVFVCFVFGFSGNFAGSVINLRKILRLRREQCKRLANDPTPAIGP